MPATTTIVGRLTKEPQSINTQSGSTMCKFTIAVNHTQNNTSFFDCVAFGKTAQIILEHGTKGRLTFASGEMSQTSYNKDGETRKVWQLAVQQINFMGKGEDQQEESPASSWDPNR